MIGTRYVGKIHHNRPQLPILPKHHIPTRVNLAVQRILCGGAASYWGTARVYEVARAARDG
jgi:hypothetical protein